MRKHLTIELAILLGFAFGCGEEVVDPLFGTGSIALIVTVNTDPPSARRVRTVEVTAESHSLVARREGDPLLAIKHGTVSLPSRDDSVLAKSETVSAPPTFNAVRAIVEGPSSNPTTIIVNLEQSGGFFEGTIDNLQPGSYSVKLLGSFDGAVTYVGANNNVPVTAGNTTNASITMNVFVPTMDPLTTPTHMFTFVASWTSVVGANTYQLQADTDPQFSNPSAFATNQTAFPLAANSDGTFYLRVRAGNDDIPVGTTAWSDPQLIEIVAGGGAAGDDQATAANLGAGPSVNGTYTDLNILPDEEDWFSVDLKANEVLSVAVRALTLPVGSELNAVLSIVDANANPLWSFDPIFQTNEDPRLISFLSPAAGTYFIQVAAWDDGQAGTASSEVGHYELVVSVNSGATTIGAGGRYSCGIADFNPETPVGSPGPLYCWGDGTFGQTAGGSKVVHSQPLAAGTSQFFIAITTGSRHACGLYPFTDVNNQGNAYCWGANEDGQLGNGDGSGTEQLSPVAVAGDHVFVLLAAGGDHTCGITLDGETYCWGRGSSGRLGNGGESNSTTPVLVADGGQRPFYTISLGYWTTCAIDIANQAWCWGFGLNGELGDGSESSVTSPSAVAGGATYEAISMGGVHSCAIRAGSGSVDCWGWQGDAALGNGSSDSGPISTPVPVLGGLTFESLAMGSRHSCGLATGSVMYCWGLNTFGQIGDGTLTSEYTAPTLTATPAGLTPTSIAAGERHTCMLGSTSELYCWGDSSLGQTGTFNALTTTPQSPLGGVAFSQIGAGNQHTCALDTGGMIYCWGNGQFGQNGQGGFGTIVTSPTPIGSGLVFEQLTVNRNHNCALEMGTGGAHCWGAGAHGRLGDGGTASQSLPVPVTGSAVFREVRAGYFHTCAISDINDLWCWGSNLRGQIGDGSGTDQTTPVTVLGNVQTAALGRNHTCAIAIGGAAFCVGENTDGQLGNGQLTDLSTYTVESAVSGGLSFDAVTTGARHTCGLVTGVAYCWGDNNWGQLGLGIGGDANVPTLVTGGLVFSDISAGDEHTCGVTLAGETYCWGRGDGAQLGMGATWWTNRPERQQDGAVNAFAVSSGVAHGCSLFAAGNAVCWGENSFGQIGTGYQGARPSPELVSGGLTFLEPGRGVP